MVHVGGDSCVWGTGHVAVGVHRGPVVKSLWPLSLTSVVIAAVAATHEEFAKLAIVLLMLAGILFYGILVEMASDWSSHVFALRRARSLFGWPLSLLFKRR